MKGILIFFVVFCSVFFIKAQQDSIFIQAKISHDLKTVDVKQTITYHNKLNKNIEKIKLLNWVAAYKNRETPLLKRLLEDRKKEMYFAKADDLGNLENLSVTMNGQEITITNLEDENIFLPLATPLPTDDRAKIELNYKLKLPSARFTKYGCEENKLNLKYFFLVPDAMETDDQAERYYINIDENQNPGTYWKVLLDLPPDHYSKSNLKEMFPHSYSGILKNDPEFLICKEQFPSSELLVSGKKIMVDYGYRPTSDELQYLEFYLPLQLQFIHEKTGALPEKIYLSEKFKKEEDFIGNDDLKFWKFRYSLFTAAENTDLDYFSLVSKNVLNQSFIYDKDEDHWLINGLKTYLEIEYLKKFYSNRKLLGDLPNNFKLFGLRPLKLFYASDLKLTERYGLGYQYIMSENFDQKIEQPYRNLSNFNKTAISHFETGSLFSFVAEKMGQQEFEKFIKSYFSEYQMKRADKKDFLDQLAVASHYSSEFLETLIQSKQRINTDLKSFKRKDEVLHVRIAKNTPEKIPLKIEAESKDGTVESYWFDTGASEEKIYYSFPDSDVSKILVNSHYIFPESNFRDNYLYTKGLFSNMKRLKFKLIRDIPNPEYNEIYVNPKVNFNAYDKFLVGINFKNTSLFERKFKFSVTPYYSSGTQKLTGSAGVSYSFMPPESFFRSWIVGVSGSYFHYDYDLKYRKFSAFSSINFTKNPRSDIGRSLGFSYNYFQKDLNPEMIMNQEYDKYNLWNVNYNYFNQMLIHEHYIGAGLQWMEDFQKISAEAYYRYEYAQDRKISFRFFGGYFLNNHTKNDLFDFGVSRVSNYAFSYGLIGQSATSGILSQQLIIADGGFKSYVAKPVNKWITALNMDGHVWKWFNVYADAGLIKNKNQNTQFIWDSGVKVKVIPDFLEVYFPVQSSLGFEPSFKDYGKRIRFTLVLRLSAITNYFRRGVF